MDRGAVIAELEAALPLARELMERRERIAGAVVGPHGLRADRFGALSDCLNAQPEFQRPGGFFIGAHGASSFVAGMACRPLLTIALEVGVEQAVNWLEKVLAARRSDVRYTVELRGLSVPSGGLEINGILFLPYQEQPVTPAAQHHSMTYAWGSGLMMPSAVAIITIRNLLVAGSHDEVMGPEQSIVRDQAVAVVARTVLALTAAINGPWSLGRSWFDFVDPDLQAASMGYTWQEALADAPAAFGTTTLTADHMEFVRKYLALSGKFGRKIDIASMRLNLARRRLVLADKAVEGSIALEALLGDDRFDLTYKLKLRAALLLELELDDHLEVMKTIGDFYKLRSVVIHGANSDARGGSAEMVNRALEICGEVLRRLVLHGKVPDWAKLELSGGAAL